MLTLQETTFLRDVSIVCLMLLIAAAARKRSWFSCSVLSSLLRGSCPEDSLLFRLALLSSGLGHYAQELHVSLPSTLQWLLITLLRSRPSALQNLSVKIRWEPLQVSVSSGAWRPYFKRYSFKIAWLLFKLMVSLWRYEQWWLCWGALVLALGTLAVRLKHPSTAYNS